MLLLKATLILLAGTCACGLLRRASADTRHRLWSWTFAALLGLPLLALALPPLPLPIPAAVSGASKASPQILVPSPPVTAKADWMTSSATPTDVEAPARPLESGEAKSAASVWNRTKMLGLTWLGGTLAAMAALGISLLRARRLARTASPVTDADWCDAARTLAAQLGLQRPVRLLVSARVSTPMAGGTWRATIYLPQDAVEWDAERRDVVLAHELAHLAARDPLRHLLARSAMALYWFHPLAWLAARQAAAAREQACDEAVLSLGTRPSSYARVLLELAESMQAPPRTLAALPIVHRSLLEARVMAILNRSPRPSRARYGRLTVFGVTAFTAVIAAAQPGAEPTVRATQWVNASPMAVATVAPEIKTSQPVASGDSCFARISGRSFAGRTSTNRRDEVFERLGVLENAHRVAFFSVEGVRLCMFAESFGPAGENASPSRWIGRASRVILESSSGSATHRMVFAGGTSEPVWQVSGTARPVDPAAHEWRQRMLAVLDTMWEKTMLEGHETSLRGEVTSLQGHETSLRGEITSLQGEVTSMEGRITSIRGEETSMHGRITSIRGHETSLQGQITSARGAITSINAGRYPAAEADRRIADYERQIERIEREIKDYNADAKAAAIEKEIQAFNADRKVAEIEKQIAGFDLDRKVAEIERRIAALKVDDKVKDIEEEIRRLDTDRKVAALESRLMQEGARLKTAIGAVR